MFQTTNQKMCSEIQNIQANVEENLEKVEGTFGENLEMLKVEDLARMWMNDRFWCK